MHSEETPLRRLIPALIALPLIRPNLFWLLGLAALINLAWLLPLENPDNLFVALAFVYGATLYRACRIMELTTYGKFSAKAQRMKVKPDPERINLPWKVMLPPALAIAAIGSTVLVENDEFVMACVVLALAIPGMVMLTWASNSVFGCLNLLRLMRLTVAAWPYYLFFTALIFGLLMLPRLWHALPAELQLSVLPVLTFVGVYLGFVLFYLFGFTLRRYQRELGLSDQLAFEEASTAGGDELSTDALIATRLASGQIEAAVSIARNAVLHDPEHIKAHERLYRLLLTAGDHAGAQAQRINLLGANLRQGNSRRALALYKDLLGTPDYSLLAEHALLLAHMAAQENDFRLALNLLSGFDKKFPGHEDIPMVYLYSAQLINARLGNSELAQNILEKLILGYPEHPLTAEAKQLLASMQDQL